jgi:hypothetical protein
MEGGAYILEGLGEVYKRVERYCMLTPDKKKTYDGYAKEYNDTERMNAETWQNDRSRPPLPYKNALETFYRDHADELTESDITQYPNLYKYCNSERKSKTGLGLFEKPKPEDDPEEIKKRLNKIITDYPSHIKSWERDIAQLTYEIELKQQKIRNCEYYISDHKQRLEQAREKLRLLSTNQSDLSNAIAQSHQRLQYLASRLGLTSCDLRAQESVSSSAWRG